MGDSPHSHYLRDINMKNTNINKYNKGLKSIRKLKPDEDAVCLPNAKNDYLKMSKKRRKQLDSQIRRFGFTECETWDLGATSCIWLYSHIKMMLDIGGKVVDFTWCCWDDELKQELRNAGVDIEKYNNDKMVFEYICELLEEADSISVDSISFEADLKVWDLQKKAFVIYGIMIPRAWW